MFVIADAVTVAQPIVVESFWLVAEYLHLVGHFLSDSSTFETDAIRAGS